MPKTKSPETHTESHEPGDRGQVPTRAIALSAGSILLFLVLLLPVMSWLLGAFGAEEERGPRADAPTDAETRQVSAWENPDADLAAQRKRERERIETYRWIDRERGVVQIPIERAMELVAARERSKSSRDSANAEGSSDE